MSLEDWLKSGRLKRHNPDQSEIRDLLAIADRDLRDSQLPGLSTDRELATAYNAALQLAAAALAASGYRAYGEGHHYWLIQSLAYTLKLSEAEIQQLDKFRKKRNISDYERAGLVSDQESNEILTLARDLRNTVEQWLRQNHPELLK